MGKLKSDAAAKRRARKRKLDGERTAEERRMNGLLDSATRDRFGSSERVLGDEMRRVGAHGKTIDSVYAAYQGEVAQLAQQQQAQMAQAAQAEAQTAQGVAGAQTALGTGQAAQTQQTAANYGLDGGAAAKAATTQAGQVGAVQGVRSQAQAGTTAAIGLGQAGRLSATQQAGSAGRVKSQERNADELKLLFGKSMELAESKGAYRSTLRREIRKQEDEQRLAEAALGVKARDAERGYELDVLNSQVRADEVRERRRTNRQDDARADRKLDNDIEARARALGQKDTELAIRQQQADAKGEGKPRLTASQASQWKQRKSRILELRKTFNSVTNGGRYRSTAEVSAYLKKQGYNRVEINMARDLSKFGPGSLSATNVTAAQSYFPGGIIPGGFTAKAK